jgi:hypothetical protein
MVENISSAHFIAGTGSAGSEVSIADLPTSSVFQKETLMRLLRFGEPRDNSSLRAINLKLRIHEDLTADLRQLLTDRTLPILDPSEVTLVEDWTIEKYVCPMLVGHFRDPRKCDAVPSDWLSFSTPLEMVSVHGKAARSLTRWYRLGEPSPLAEDSLRIWSSPDGR